MSTIVGRPFGNNETKYPIDPSYLRTGSAEKNIVDTCLTSVREKAALALTSTDRAFVAVTLSVLEDEVAKASEATGNLRVLNDQSRIDWRTPANREATTAAQKAAWDNLGSAESAQRDCENLLWDVRKHYRELPREESVPDNQAASANPHLGALKPPSNPKR